MKGVVICKRWEISITTVEWKENRRETSDIWPIKSRFLMY